MMTISIAYDEYKIIQLKHLQMRRFILLLVLPLFYNTYAQTGIPVPEMTHCDTKAMNFMSTFNIPSMTFALAKDGKLVYSRAFGNADLSATIPTQPYNMFRIASVSKPITSIGIMKMMEDGLLNMNDKVFGTGGILENHWVFSNANITDNRVYDITVQMLLEHTGGWDSNINCNPNPTSPYPWFFAGCHPIDIPLRVTQVFGQPNPVREEHLIQYILEKPLNYDPGTTYAYSNMGYLILSEIIEEISGMDYEAWMQQEIFNPLGIFDMHIGENLLADKREREGEYVGNGYTTLDLYGSGNTVPWTYGGASVNAMDGHGGWIATARDLVRLLVAVDGFATKPDILSPASIATMSTPSSVFQNYAKGWQVNASNNWWHSGAIGGTASFWVRSNNGYTWAIIMNKRIVDGSSNAFWAQLDALGWNCIAGTSTWPTHDLLESPTINASNLQSTNITESGMTLSWTIGNGTSRIVVAKEVSGPADNQGYYDAYPLDGIDYTANSTLGVGDALGDGSFVVYNGTETSMNLQGLNGDTDYAIRVYDYKKNTANGNNALYLLGNVNEIVASTSTLSINSNDLDTQIKLFPNPAHKTITLQNNGNMKLTSATITDVNGRVVQTISLENMHLQKEISLSDYSSGVYLVKINGLNGSITKRIMKN